MQNPSACISITESFTSTLYRIFVFALQEKDVHVTIHFKAQFKAEFFSAYSKHLEVITARIERANDVIGGIFGNVYGLQVLFRLCHDPKSYELKGKKRAGERPRRAGIVESHNYTSHTLTLAIVRDSYTLFALQPISRITMIGVTNSATNATQES